MDFTTQSANSNITATWIDWGDGSNPDLIFNMTSSSMCQSPGTDMCTIAPGDLLFAKPEDPASIVNGSIIIFRPSLQYQNYLVAHRVVWIFPPNSTSNQYVFFTKGDANAQTDNWTTGPGTPASQVVAVYQYTMLPLVSPIERVDTHAYRVLGGLTSKTFTVTVNATDGSGAQTQGTIETINDAPPTIGITGASPNPIVAGSKLTLGFIATDSDGTISTVTINWGDGTALQDYTGNAGSETHLYNSEGNYTIVIQATDDAGLTSTPEYSTIAVRAQPSNIYPTISLGVDPLLFFWVAAIFLVSIGAMTILVLKNRRGPASIKP